METQQTLLFCFLTGASFLSDTAAGFTIYTATEGQNVSFEFPFTLVGGGRRYLCREEWNTVTDGNLIRTTENPFENLDSSELTSQNPVSSSLQFQRVSSTTLTDLHILCGAKTLIQTEGGSIAVKCSFTLSGKGKYVCRDPCKNGDVLIETEAKEAQKGRYSIRYREGTFPASSTVLYVNISQLTQSDSGRYWCGLKRRLMIDSRQEFNVNVTNDMKELEQATGVSKDYVLPLALCVATLFAAAVLLLYKWKARRESDDSTSRRQSSSSSNNRRQRSTQFSASKFTNRTPPTDTQQQLYYNL
ncbi:uncharacterized protein LOC129377000 [Poeciliopsis prolifica]|uniref:uncharacterized protein LOC129377000 n=1 Tax=Poeciliopsis prolifica TaxID=188132 RepID=UPI00241448F6|nr:uncharacterized protein LOC129377000 [Poeciliopsis prolifica]